MGAGAMGSGIAEIANSGHQVLLLDLGAKDSTSKAPAAAALNRLLTLTHNCS